MFFSLALCLVISYGMFYYVKKRLSIIEQSQMEQARIMQKVIAFQFLYESKNDPEVYVKKACNNVEGLIEITNDNYSEAQDVKQLPIFNQNSRSKTEFQSISNPEHREFVDNEFDFFQELEQPKEHMQTTSPMNPLS